MDRQSYRIIANPAPPRREISGYRQIFLSTALPRIAACTAGRPTDLNRRNSTPVNGACGTRIDDVDGRQHRSLCIQREDPSGWMA